MSDRNLVHPYREAPLSGVACAVSREAPPSYRVAIVLTILCAIVFVLILAMNIEHAVHHGLLGPVVDALYVRWREYHFVR